MHLLLSVACLQGWQQRPDTQSRGAPRPPHRMRSTLVLPTHDEQAANSLFAELRQTASALPLLAPAPPTSPAMPVADPNAGWIVCEGVAGFASLQEGVRRARAAVERGDHSAMQPVPEPVGEFIKDWMAKRYALSQNRAQTVFVLDDASRIWASRLITYLSQLPQLPQASSQRLHFIHRTIAGATVSLAQVRLAGGAQADSQIYWADARGRGRTSHEVRDAFSANGDVLTVLVGPMSANAFDKVSSMLRGQWELRRGSLRRVVLLVTLHSPPPRQAIDALLEDFAGAARAAYVNLSDTGQCWNAMLAAAQDLPQRAATVVAAEPAPLVQLAPAAPDTHSPAYDVLELYAAHEGLRSVALFNHLGELILQREGTSGLDNTQSALFGFTDGVASPDEHDGPEPASATAIDPTDPKNSLRRSRQGEALRALLAAAGLQPPKHLLMESVDALDVVEPVLGMPTLWLWSNFSARHVAPVHAQVLSGRLAADLAHVLGAHDDPWFALNRPSQPTSDERDIV
jgi:hypothetical protein